MSNSSTTPHAPAAEPRTHSRRGLLAVAALASLLLVGLHPFSYTSLATSFDGLLHLYRLVELDHLMQQGIYFPRWAPDFVFGFGYPLFNFYAPLAYYLTAPLHWLGFSFVDSATIFFAACTLAATAAMFGFVRALLADTHAALVAAVLYAYAPTHIYDNFYRSAWGTVLAYALVPFCLWAILRWHDSARPRYVWLLALGIAALMLAHNVSALLTMPVIGAAALLPLLPSTAPARVLARRTAHTLIALACGLALSAFFWLPALAETRFIQTWRLTIPPDFDFHTHFLSMSDWVAWPAPAEVGRINPDLVNTVGPLHMLMAVAGMAASFFARGRTRIFGFFFSMVLCIALFMTLQQSAWLWEHIALLPSIQFPHRLLTLVALCASVLGAMVVHQTSERWRAAASLAISALIVIAAIPFLYPRALPPVNPNPTLADVLAHEHKTGALGTTASGEYLPFWVQFVPKASTFEEAIVNGENPQRFESRSLPSGGSVIAQQSGPLWHALRVSAPTAFRATFRHFYFPGWQGYVDGAPVLTSPSAGQGFATFEVPAGEHEIALVFTSTPIRDAAIALSLLSALLGLGWVALTRRQARSATAPAHAGHQPLPSSYLWLGLGLLLFKLFVADRYDTPLRVTFDGERVPTVQYARSIGLANTITWLGYDLTDDTVLPAQSLDVTLYWQAQRELDTVYSAFAHLIDERANLYAQKDNLHPGGAPTTTWRPREYDVDRHRIEIPAGTPPGDYWLAIGMYDPHQGARLLREDAKADEPRDRIMLGPITVRKAAQPPSIASLPIQLRLARSWPSGLALLGFSSERERLPADDFLRVALYWRAEAAPLPATAMSLRLVNAQHETVSSQRSEPSNDRYPTTRWTAGEIVRDNRALWIASSLPSGAYRLQLQVGADSEWLDLQTLIKP